MLAQDGSEVVGRLGEVRIRTADVFAEDTEALWKRAVNGIHWTTREETIRNEIWFEPGEELTRAELDELERNLRRTGLFAEVSAEVVPSGLPDRVDLLVTTRDRLSIVFGFSGSLVGDVGSVRGTLGETNLLGLGDRLVVDYEENTEGELEGAISYRDRHLFGRWMRLGLRAGTTEEGDEFGVFVDRPLQHLVDRWSWSLDASTVESDVDYFEGGDSVAEVPERLETIGGSLTHAFGPRDSRLRLGVAARWSDRAYGVAAGPQAGTIDVPGDTSTLFGGPFVAYDRFRAFERETRLDTLDFVQDLQLGYGAELLVGPRWRDEEGLEDEVEPQASLRTYAAAQPFEDIYVTFTGGGSLRLDAGEAVGWTADTSLHTYRVFERAHTLAASLTFDQVFESEDLPIEVTLGEDNGLRGYPAREFSGERRIRVNLEERYDTGLEWASLNLGLVAFFDAGWIADPDQDLGSPLRSAGLGVRLGSQELLGGTVIRIDLAFPFDERDGTSYEPSLSVALGQVFSFFGNQATLSTR